MEYHHIISDLSKWTFPYSHRVFSFPSHMSTYIYIYMCICDFVRSFSRPVIVRSLRVSLSLCSLFCFYSSIKQKGFNQNHKTYIGDEIYFEFTLVTGSLLLRSSINNNNCYATTNTFINSIFTCF
jgi:hypothetical protein